MSEPTDTRLFDAGERPSPKALFVRDLPDGETVETILLVKESAVAQRRSGEDYLRLKLCDCTGTLEAIAWDGVAEVREIAQPGIALRVRGRYEVSQRYGPQLVLKSASLAQAGDYRLADLMDAPAASAEQMEADLRRLIDTVRNPWLGEAARRPDRRAAPRCGQRFRRAPAAKYYHQAYLHGLLEHSLSVGQAVSAVSGSFPGVDRDLAVTGGLIHDIGKIEAYESDPVAIDLTDEGKLLGEIPLGYYTGAQHDRADRRLSARAGARACSTSCSPTTARSRTGAPWCPCTREATVVHAIDNLGGKLGSFDRLEKGLQEGETWSRFDRALSGSAYFGRSPHDPTPAARAGAGSPARRVGRVAAAGSSTARGPPMETGGEFALPWACLPPRTTSSEYSWWPCWPGPPCASTRSTTASRSSRSCGPTG